MRTVPPRGLLPLLRALGLVGLLLLPCQPESAAALLQVAPAPQSPAPEKRNSEWTQALVEQRIGEVKERVRAAEQAENEQTAQQWNVSLREVQERTSKLRALEETYQRLLTAQNKGASLEKEEAGIQDRLKNQQHAGLSQPPPYSLGFYNDILDQLSAAEQERQTFRMAMKMGERTLEDARARLEEAQKGARVARDKAGGEDAGAKAPPAQRFGLDQAKLEEELAQVALEFQKMNMLNLARASRLQDLKRDAAQQSVSWVRENLRFEQEDLDRQLGGIEQRKAELQRRLRETMNELREGEGALALAQKKAAGGRDEAETLVLQAAVKTQETWRDVRQRILEQTEEMLQLLGQQEHVWKSRFSLAGERLGPDRLASMKKESESQLRDIGRALRLAQSQQPQLQSQIMALEKQMAESAGSPRLRPLLEQKMHALRRLAERSLDYQALLVATDQIHQRLLDEIAAQRKEAGWWERAWALTTFVRDGWNFELWAIDQHSVTVKKLVIALIILTLGIGLVKRIIRALGRRFAARARLEPSAAAAIEKIAYYLSLLLVVLFALRMVNIPLTAFTFLGGAIAIGVGFGAQNLINNFISGFIIMAERPIRINDLIEMDGSIAIVEEIGARCTRIRTGANVHILVPNSSFLEKNITNWTLSDKVVRANVSVGVSYGSPLEEVRRLLIQAASEHEKVMEDPAPFALFNGFGDNALEFDVYFWVSVERVIERRMIESDIRFRIDELFREARIVVAFPQRDIHLDTPSPLDVRVLPSQS